MPKNLSAAMLIVTKGFNIRYIGESVCCFHKQGQMLST